jgi:hypothetical protein
MSVCFLIESELSCCPLLISIRSEVSRILAVAD